MKAIGANSRIGCVLDIDFNPEQPVDKSCFGQPCTNNGSTWNVIGRSFDGNDYIDCGSANSLNITDKISIVSKVYTTANLTEYIIAKNSLSSADIQYGTVRDLTADACYFYINGASRTNTPNNSFSLRTWKTIISTYDRLNACVYIDKNRTASSSYTAAITSTTFNLVIGKRNPSNLFWSGWMKKIQIFNRTLYLPECQST